MSGKYIFNFALGFSIVWHLLWVEMVTIVWPAKLIRPQHAAINFLGQILEGSNQASGFVSSFELKKEKMQSEAEKEQGRENIQVAVLPEESIAAAELSVNITPEFKIDTTAAKQSIIAQQVNEDIEHRSVIYKPELPVYPQWVKEIDFDFGVELKFLILPDGTVGNVERITSSGHPELDEIGVRYIRKWKFMPLPTEMQNAGQWGIIKLIFRLQ